MALSLGIKLFIGTGIIVVIIAAIIIANDAGWFKGLRQATDPEEGDDPESYEVGEEHRALLIVHKGAKEIKSGYVTNIYPKTVDEVGDEDATLELDNGGEEDVTTAKILIVPALSSLRDGIYEWHYYEDGLSSAEAETLQNLKEKLKKKSKRLMVAESESKREHLTLEERTQKAAEEKGALRRAGRGKQGYGGKDNKGDDDEEDDEDKDEDDFEN